MLQSAWEEVLNPGKDLKEAVFCAIYLKFLN